jgi:hypothetical protein
VTTYITDNGNFSTVNSLSHPSEMFPVSSKQGICTMNCVLAVVEVRVVYFAVEDEPPPCYPLGHAPGQRAEVRSIILVC